MANAWQWGVCQPNVDPAIYAPDGRTRAERMRLPWPRCTADKCEWPQWTSKVQGIAGVCFNCHCKEGFKYFLGDEAWRRKLVLRCAAMGHEEFLGIAPYCGVLWTAIDQCHLMSTMKTLQPWCDQVNPPRQGIGFEASEDAQKEAEVGTGLKRKKAMVGDAVEDADEYAVEKAPEKGAGMVVVRWQSLAWEQELVWQGSA